MSSKKNRALGIGPRIILWSTLLLSFSLICVSMTVYYLMSASLRQSDHELIMRLAHSYSRTFLREGESALRSELSPDVVVTITDNNGKELLKILPKFFDHDFEDEEELEQVAKATEKLRLKEGWSRILLLSGEEDQDFFHRLEYKFRRIADEREWESILPLIDNDMVEVYTMPIDGSRWIRVGRSSEDREEHLAQIRNISLIVILPFIFFGWIMSFLLSRSILAPVKNLIQTIRLIKGGQENARALVTSSGDEVGELTEEFNALLEHNQELIDQQKTIVDNVAHDIRTPLTRFRISAENALAKDDYALAREALQECLENSDDILKLLNAIMDVSEAESKTMNIQKERIKVDQIINDLVDLYQFVAEEKNIKLKTDHSKEVIIEGDRVRLMQAFGNILDNALKFSPPNTEVRIREKRNGSFVEISIEDEGPGIDADEVEKIWRRLYRGDQSRSTPGLGIGLSVVKAIITAHQGQVYVNSLNSGSTFVVSLPICNA